MFPGPFVMADVLIRRLSGRHRAQKRLHWMRAPVTHGVMPTASARFPSGAPVQPPTRPGHCSICGLASISDPCTLCGLEEARRAINERARAERMKVKFALDAAERT